MHNYSSKQYAGFTLVEMAIVLVILAFVLSALLLPLQAQRTQAFQAQTESTLENAKRALLGFAQQQGRLPCPATAASNGIESQAPAGSGTCTQQVGFLPAASLGIQPTNVQGFAIDAWNNPIRYGVTQTNNAGVVTTHFTTVNGMANQGIANLQPNLRVCSTSVGINASRCSGGAEANYLINNAAAVIYSIGATGAQAVGGADEAANLNNDPVFVSHDPVATGGNEFDHIVVWISPFVLYNAMIQAGQLH
jgi:prepilin-type N-terminal cleavage/methylation domain-containing protein